MKYENEIILFVVAGSVVLFLLGMFMVSFLFIYQKRQIAYLQEKQALKDSYEQEILKAQLETQNQTLQYVGQELHDNLGQLLSVVRINLSTLQQEPLPEPVRLRIQDTKEIVSNAITDLRSMSKSLDEGYLQEFGLLESINNELDRISRTGHFATQLVVEGDSYRLDKRHEIILFRLGQEALNNAMKHSSASRLWVKARYDPDFFELSVEDNGSGFDYEATLKSNGSGLRNFKNRTNLIGAECRISSGQARGTQVKITLPTLSLTPHFT